MIGSSNASANGLGYEGKELTNNLELNLFVTAPATKKAAEGWFDKLWKVNEAHGVDGDVLERARPFWRKHRGSRVAANRLPTLLTALADRPEAFGTKNIRVLVYKWDEEGEGPLERRARSLSSPEERRCMDAAGDTDWYWDDTAWSVERGTTFLDFDLARRGSPPRFGGVWQVRTDGQWLLERGNERVILCRRMKSVDGLPFPTPEPRQLSQAIRTHIESHDLWKADAHNNNLEMPLYEFWLEHREELRPSH